MENVVLAPMLDFSFFVSEPQGRGDYYLFKEIMFIALGDAKRHPHAGDSNFVYTLIFSKN